jgi:hypothetical protein
LPAQAGGDPQDEGYRGSWWTAVVVTAGPGKWYEVEYDEVRPAWLRGAVAGICAPGFASPLSQSGRALPRCPSAAPAPAARPGRRQLTPAAAHPLQLLADDAVSKYRERLPASRLRPRAPDDSFELPLAARSPGDAVDCWHADGWWEGVVKSVWADHISIYFPSECQRQVLSIATCCGGGGGGGGRPSSRAGLGRSSRPQPSPWPAGGRLRACA